MAARSVRFRRTVGLAGVTAAVAGAAVAVAPPAVAAEPYCTTTWNGGNGAWSDAANWSTGETPAATDYICILSTSGEPAPVVSVGASTTVKAVTMLGATLRLPAAGTVLTTGDFAPERSLVTGRGTVQGAKWGMTVFRQTRLGGGLALLTDGSVTFRGALTFGGGARVVQSFVTGFTTFEGDVAVSDGDAHPANHLTLNTQNSEIAAGTEVAIKVPFAARNSTLTVLGTLRLPRYDGFDAGGVLSPVGDYTRFATYGAGRVVLPRTVTRLAPGTVVERSSALVAPGGGDALTALTSIAGALMLQRPLVLSNPLEVSGGLRGSSSLRVPSLTVPAGGYVALNGVGLPEASVTATVVRVAAGASFGASVVRGRLESAGTTAVSGAQWGALQLTGKAVSTLSVTCPATVDRGARLAGQARVALPAVRDLPADGARVVVLTAAGGITGRFAGVLATPPARGSVTLEYTPTQVVAVYHAPV